MTTIDDQLELGGPGTRHAVIRGELDASVSDHCRDVLVAAMRAEPGSWSLDLRGVTFIDSAGVSVLVSVHRAADGEPVEVTASAPVLRVIDLAGIAGLFRLIDER